MEPRAPSEIMYSFVFWSFIGALPGHERPFQRHVLCALLSDSSIKKEKKLGVLVFHASCFRDLSSVILAENSSSLNRKNI